MNVLATIHAGTLPPPADNGVVITAVSVVMVAVVTSVIAPMVADRLKERRDNDPMRGWRTAYSDMADRLDKAERKIADLEATVKRHEETIDSQSETIAQQNITIEQQSRAIRARDNRIAQLEESWPGKSLPTPDPAVLHWLSTGST